MIAQEIPDELDDSDYRKYDPYALAFKLGGKLNKAKAEIVKLRSALSELTALVRGECGALLDEDRGGSASLSMEIDDLLGPNEPSSPAGAALCASPRGATS